LFGLKSEVDLLLNLPLERDLSTSAEERPFLPLSLREEEEERKKSNKLRCTQKTKVRPERLSPSSRISFFFMGKKDPLKESNMERRESE